MKKRLLEKILALLLIAVMLTSCTLGLFSCSGNGGDGWLRLLEFMPDGKTVKATTFSPFFYGSTSTAHMAWKTDERNQFTFVLE